MRSGRVRRDSHAGRRVDVEAGDRVAVPATVEDACRDGRYELRDVLRSDDGDVEQSIAGVGSARDLEIELEPAEVDDEDGDPVGLHAFAIQLDLET